MGYGSGVAMSCGVGRRHSSDPALLWLWHRPAAMAPIGSLAWEPPYARKQPKKWQKDKKKKERNMYVLFLSTIPEDDQFSSNHPRMKIRRGGESSHWEAERLTNVSSTE